MDIIEHTRELGKLIQADPRYVAYHKAREENDADTALQDLIGEFNLKRMALNKEMNKPDRDQIKLSEIDAEVKYLYGEIMGNPSMAAFTAAKGDMDAMLAEVNAIITMSANGEDPATCTPPKGGCSGSCEGCAGCG